MVKPLQKSSSPEPLVDLKKELGMKHRWLKYYNVYINHDPVMTLTYFTTTSTWVAYAFEWVKLLKCHLKGKNTCRKVAYGQDIDYSEEKKWHQDLICLLTGINYFPKYSNMFIGIYNRSQASGHRTIGPLVSVLMRDLKILISFAPNEPPPRALDLIFLNVLFVSFLRHMPPSHIYR